MIIRDEIRVDTYVQPHCGSDRRHGGGLAPADDRGQRVRTVGRRATDEVSVRVESSSAFSFSGSPSLNAFQFRQASVPMPIASQLSLLWIARRPSRSGRASKFSAFRSSRIAICIESRANGGCRIARGWSVPSSRLRESPTGDDLGRSVTARPRRQLLRLPSSRRYEVSLLPSREHSGLPRGAGAAGAPGPH